MHLWFEHGLAAMSGITQALFWHFDLIGAALGPVRSNN
jgi:hypothetical protein